MGKTAYINARLIDPESKTDKTGGLIVSGKTIQDIGSHITAKKLPDNIKIIDCEGKILCPGLIDMRVAINQKETFENTCQAASAGGITTLIALPIHVNNDNIAQLSFVEKQAKKQKKTKIHSYATLTQNCDGESLSEIGLLSDRGALGFTDDLQTLSSAKVMARALSYAQVTDALILNHPDEPSLSQQGHINKGELATRMGLNGIPREAEIIGLERDIRLVEMTGGRYHATNISTSDSVDIIRKAKDKGLHVTCDTAPFYFSLTELDVTDYRTFTKLTPPLRNEDDRKAIAKAVADGTIDVITSDHRPEDQDSKRLPFDQATTGAIGLETLLSLSLHLAEETNMSLYDMIASLTLKPAEILGLNHAGRLKKGGMADFIVFDPQVGWKMDASTLHSKAKNTPYDKRPMTGKVLRTIIDGRLVFELKD